MMPTAIWRPPCAAAGARPVVAPILMRTDADRRSLARRVLAEIAALTDRQGNV